MKAVAVFQGHLCGYVEFKQVGEKVRIKGEVYGLKKNSLHGFHIHTYGDLRNNCKNACSHFNPYVATHGGRGDSKMNRHVGDLGNVKTDRFGVAKINFTDDMISLNMKKKNCVIGRSIVIHSGEDDLGMGGNKESLKTGNAGSRLDCAVIGIAK